MNSSEPVIVKQRISLLLPSYDKFLFQLIGPIECGDNKKEYGTVSN